MLYRALHAINCVYPYLALFGFIGAFLLAFICMFIFPPGSLLILLVGLLSLGFVVGGRRALTAIEYALARAALRDGRAPGSGDPVITTPHGWRCPSTRTEFLTSGAVVESQPSQQGL